MSRPRAVPKAISPDQSRGRSPSNSQTRHASIARLASPLPVAPSYRSTSSSQAPQDSGPLSPGLDAGPLGSLESRLGRPGRSALSAAFQGSLGSQPVQHGTPPHRAQSPEQVGHKRRASNITSVVGSFENRSVQGTIRASRPQDTESAEVVRKHLLGPQHVSPSGRMQSPEPAEPQFPFSLNDEPGTSLANPKPSNPNDEDREFDSLRLQGGDITRPIYRWVEQAEANDPTRTQRSRSFHISRPMPDADGDDIQNIKAPGGFRRDFLRRTAGDESSVRSQSQQPSRPPPSTRPPPFTSNFIEFLSLYGHFAGERLDEDDDSSTPPDDYLADQYDAAVIANANDYAAGEDRDPGEESGLLGPKTPGQRRKSKVRRHSGTGSARSAALLLLKSFIGTGVLFLPRAYVNGGMVFSNIVLLTVAILCYYCFILLVKTNLKVNGSFGKMGYTLYGRWMQWSILASVVISQIGFSAAYMVFVSENLKTFIATVSDCKVQIGIPVIVLSQLVLFLPLSLVRDINKLSMTALVADVLILMGLLYLYYFDIYTIAKNHGVSDIIAFNSHGWTLFIGTAIFAFEGIGLILPIQEGMKYPQQFPPVLAGVMAIVVVVTVSMGALSYAAFGSKTQTVVLLNLPHESVMSSIVQFVYSIAILLSTPLQIFPAIRITENSVFSKSGKFNAALKWQKNTFRFCMTIFIAVIAWGGADDLDKFVSLVGSFACIPLVFIYPPLLHSRAVAKGRLAHMANAFLIVLGFLVMIYTTGLTLSRWGKHTHKKLSHCEQREIGGPH